MVLVYLIDVLESCCVAPASRHEPRLLKRAILIGQGGSPGLVMPAGHRQGSRLRLGAEIGRFLGFDSMTSSADNPRQQRLIALRAGIKGLASAMTRSQGCDTAVLQIP